MGVEYLSKKFKQLENGFRVNLNNLTFTNTFFHEMFFFVIVRNKKLNLSGVSSGHLQTKVNANVEDISYG